MIVTFLFYKIFLLIEVIEIHKNVIIVNWSISSDNYSLFENFSLYIYLKVLITFF